MRRLLRTSESGFVPDLGSGFRLGFEGSLRHDLAIRAHDGPFGLRMALPRHRRQTLDEGGIRRDGLEAEFRQIVPRNEGSSATRNRRHGRNVRHEVNRGE